MAVFGAGLVDSVARRAGILASAALLACVLAFNFWGTIDSARSMPPGLTTQFNPATRIDHAYDPMLIEFLSSHGEMRGYTDYWVAYPLAFLTAESVLYVPRLPYHADLGYTPRDDRYAPYDDVVSQSPRFAYITTGPRSVESTLEGYFARLGVSYQVADIGDYHVYYALSRRVPPPDFTDMSEE
jgi:hypothetical protein